MAVCGGLTYSCEKKRREKQWRKGEIFPSECRVQKNNKERFKKKKASSKISAKKQRKTTEWERLEISSRKVEI